MSGNANAQNGKGNAAVHIEEDVDELDDVLEQFVPPPASKPPQASSSAPKPVPEEAEVDAGTEEEFAAQLAKEMEAMMHALSTDDKEEFEKAWQGATKEQNGAGPGDDSEESDAFQKAIKQAMEKMQTSEESLKADGPPDAQGLENLLSSLGDFNLGEGGEGEEQLQEMLETMMSQLMSKEILYDPLKELDSKYPEYLSNNAVSIKSEDLERYTQQKTRVAQLVRLFEQPDYSDSNPEQNAEVLRLMNEMQSYGSPPEEIMGEMPPGFELGGDGMPKMPDGCVIT